MINLWTCFGAGCGPGARLLAPAMENTVKPSFSTAQALSLHSHHQRTLTLTPLTDGAVSNFTLAKHHCAAALFSEHG
ncbi:hypothetical protein AOLI_G00073520 [Acnodon oligacanthus]